LRILLADDHVMLRQAVRAELEQQGHTVVAEASDGHEAVQLGRKLHPDIAVLDVSMPVLNGIDAARELLKDSPRIGVLLVTMHADDEFILQGLRAGVKGYVLKTRTMSELVQAVAEVAKGKTYLSPGASDRVVDAFLRGTEAAVDPLSVRERQVLQLVAEGKTTKDIAGLLNISTNTVESHRTNIMQKLDIHDTAGLVRYAIRRGLIQS
jgi:two-component system, NarL family, response regulator NreC